MKRRISTLLVAVLLLSAAVLFTGAAGSAADPLISRSYITDTFLPQTRAALSETASQTLSAWYAAPENAPPTRILTLEPGQSVKLSAGQQLTVLSGAVNLFTETGTLLDLSIGAPAENGAARLYARYLAAEDSVVYADATRAAAMKVSYTAQVGTGSPFTDVTRTEWFFSDVVSAHDRGLVNGITAEIYGPGGTLTGAECVKLAACMHELYQSGSVTLTPPAEGEWYRSYVDYALEHGILSGELDEYNAPVTREKFVSIFYRALPESAYGEINAVPDGAIPDVTVEDAGAEEIYRFYRAGILAGYTAAEGRPAHTFGADTTISRAEVAAIMNRMLDETARVSFTMD